MLIKILNRAIDKHISTLAELDDGYISKYDQITSDWLIRFIVWIQV